MSGAAFIAESAYLAADIHHELIEIMIRKTRTPLTTRLLLRATSFIVLVSTTALAQNGLPPVIDRELLFGNPEISGAQISPDGKFIAFRKPHKSTINIWVKSADEPFVNARLLTNETRRPPRQFLWSHDGKFILFTKDKGGDRVDVARIHLHATLI